MTQETRVHNALDDVAGNGQYQWAGLAEIARHVIGCHLTQDAVVQSALGDVAGNICQGLPSHHITVAVAHSFPRPCPETSTPATSARPCATDPGDQTLGNIFNLVSAANLAVTTCNTLFTVYIMLALSSKALFMY